ncbi:response regulator [Cohnella massiliensis]|uniref:response regulator n=1 Tax=Cohnella massiliensis TaxID=1816691 RepID=UPI001593E288|nr:response regulator [Cohnella massiliensis]
MLRVLLVDDEYMVLDALCSDIRWEKLGLEVVATAANGRQALERCAVYFPDLVITDITMPVMDGIELMAELRKGFPHVRFAILTAHKDFEYAKQAIALGALDYVLKTPLNPEEIEATLLRCKDAIGAEKEMKQRALIGDRLEHQHSWEIRKRMAEDIDRGLFNFERDGANLIRGSGELRPKMPYRVLYVALQDRIAFFAGYAERDHSLIRFTMNQAIYESIPNRAEGDVLPLGNGESAVILQKPASSSKADSEIQIQQLYDHINQWFKKYLGTPLLCGISSDATDYAELKRAISQAVQAKETFFYDNRSSLHFYHQYHRIVWSHETEQDWNLLSQKLSLKWSVPDVDKRIEGIQLLLSFVLEKRPTPSKLKSAVLRVLEELAMPLTRQEWLRMEHSDSLEDWLSHLEKIMAKAHKQDAELPVQVHPEIQKAVDFIYAHLSENLTLNKVAEHVHLNPSYLSHLFKIQTGDNFLDFLTEQRVRKAKEFLLQSDLKNYELAEKVGFVNYPHFCTVFKKSTGMTPNEFRRHYKTGHSGSAAH